MNYTTLLYPILAILPSYIWLLFFLKKDKDPEPNLKALLVFFLGMVVTIPAAFLEFLFLKILETSNISGGLFIFLKYFLIIALIEEGFKYLIPRLAVFKSSVFDQPIDAPLYLMVSALGFAAVENILGTFNLNYTYFLEPYFFLICRFLTATLLHAIASGMTGIFVAWGYYNFKKKNLLISLGIILASLLHGIYNYSIINIQNATTQNPIIFLCSLVILIFILIGGGIFLNKNLKKLRNLKGICKIEDIKKT